MPGRLKSILLRIAQAIPVVVGVVIVSFVLTRALPGDPAVYFAGAAADEASIAQIREALGLDRSMPEQFAVYVGDLLQGDFGQSISTGQPVHGLDDRVGRGLEGRFEAHPLRVGVADLVHEVLELGGPVVEGGDEAGGEFDLGREDRGGPRGGVGGARGRGALLAEVAHAFSRVAHDLLEFAGVRAEDAVVDHAGRDEQAVVERAWVDGFGGGDLNGPRDRLGRCLVCHVVACHVVA